MKGIAAVFLSLILYVSLLMIPVMMEAQTENSYLNTNYTTNISEGTVTESDGIIDPLWFAPLFAIPLAYILYRVIKNYSPSMEMGSYSSYPALVGVKGGKAKHTVKKEEEEKTPHKKSSKKS